jgi:hypothetical protein
VAKVVLIPISFALLISFILLPLALRFENWGVTRMMAALFSILAIGIGFGRRDLSIFNPDCYPLSVNLRDFRGKDYPDIC